MNEKGLETQPSMWSEEGWKGVTNNGYNRSVSNGDSDSSGGGDTIHILGNDNTVVDLLVTIDITPKASSDDHDDKIDDDDNDDDDDNNGDDGNDDDDNGDSLSLIHIWRCRRSTLCRSRWSPYH